MSESLKERIPDFDRQSGSSTGSLGSALSQPGLVRSSSEALAILAVAVLIIGGIEVWLRVSGTQSYIFPKPSEIGLALVENYGLFWPHIVSTVTVLITGFLIGSGIGLVLAATITQVPFIEKIITPYILLLVTTPMIALVPLLSAKLGYDSMSPRIVAVALASGPIVMINATTGFRRTDLGKIALARSYGASTIQLFTRIRFPMALPMIIVGLMMGAIMGLLTAVGAEMVGSSEGLGSRLVYYSARVQMDNFFAIIVILAVIGIIDYIIFTLIGRKWASWEA